jgi:hypothetical protein
MLRSTIFVLEAHAQLLLSPMSLPFCKQTLTLASQSLARSTPEIYELFLYLTKKATHGMNQTAR